MKSNFSAGKSFASFCLLMLLFVPLISACKTNIGSSSSSSSSNNGPTNLTLWTVPSAGEVGNPPPNWFLIKDVHDKLNINLKVTFLPYGDDGDTKMNAAAAANDLPDFFQVPSNNNIFLQWVRQGLIAPVDSLLPLMPGRTKDRYNDPQMQKIATINGKQYVLQEKTVLNKRQGLLIRKDWLNKLGLKEPKTLDDLLKVAEAFTRNDPDGNGKNDTYGFAATTGVSSPGLGGGWQAFFGAYGLPGVWNFNTPGKISLSLRDPGYLKVVQFLRKMADEKLIDPAWPTLSTNDFRAGWKQQGKYGIISEDFCAAQCQANYQSFDTNFPQGDWEPLAPPQGPNGQSFLGASNNVGLRIAVSKKALDEGKGPAIAKFLEWTNTGEGYYETAFGQKGVHYTFDAQGNVTGQGVPVPFYSHEAAPINQIRNLVYKNTPAELKARYNSFKTKNGRTIDPVKIYDAFASFPWQDQTAAFVIQPASNQADINRYVDENLVQFITGQKPLTDASWNSFIKGLDGLNVSDWEAQANKQLKDGGFIK
ncbi:extracellular solute-binding protein [Dictyobacter aurantiacus]|uniref:Putative ABC transporter peptide-binding protein YtcQ n=1 Tax=Dictyobacter aurantiacus TaxID=1936993 RepID=A0A401ZGJ1_9CHLR|nr:extracellular solute-binding protein [Dictyobacter aurantiacus]GCE05972.1 putative ABC transporter peptide-binding protein YtcQ [Dictyobacter aurantiacus]